MSPFDDEIVSAITTYMNGNHPELLLRIIASHGASPQATTATLVDLSGTAAVFDVEIGDDHSRIEVPWTRTITTRAQIREELFELANTA